MPIKASRSDVARLRLRAHGLAGDELASPADVVERMLALQAQDLLAGMWALGVRSPGSTAADVAAAINSGAIVRAWPMRGTLHFVPPADLGWMLQLTTPRLLAGARTRRAQLELDQSVIERARAVAMTELHGGRQLGRAGFLGALEEHGIATKNQRGYHLIWHLAQSGTLCWGRLEGKSQLLALQDEWVRSPRRLAREEALGEYVLRYFTGHGPASLTDFIGWSQLTVADATVGLAEAAGRLTALDVDGTTLYLAASTDAASLGAPILQRSPVLALPGFDEYLLGYRDRGFAIDDDKLVRVVPGKNGIFLPLIVATGRVIGTWRRTTNARTVVVEPMPFAPLGARREAGFRRSIRHYADFLDLTDVVVVRPAEAAALA